MMSLKNVSVFFQRFLFYFHCKSSGDVCCESSEKDVAV